MADRDALARYARQGVWALPLWALLLFVGTLTHQPSYRDDFPAYARYISTRGFLVSHIVASIVGAGIGSLGFAALFAVLVRLGKGRAGVWALTTSLLGNALVTSVIGVAAFAQPAIGRAYLAGHTTEIVALNRDVYGPELGAIAAAGVILLMSGLIVFGVAAARSGSLPKPAGVLLVVGAPLFALIGVILADVVQSVGAVLLLVSTAWIAWSVSRRPAERGDQPA